MDNTSQVQSIMSTFSPEHDNLDKSICNNLVKDIAIDLVNFKIKIEEEYIMMNSINTLIV